MNFNGSTAANTSNTVAVESVVNSSTAIVTTNRTTVVTSKPPETTTRLPVTTQALRNPTTGMNISFPSGGKYNNKTSISTTRVILTTTPSSTSTPTTPAAAAAVAAAAAAAGVAGSGINSGGVLTTTGLLQSGAAAAATAAAAAGTTVSPVTSDPGYGLRHPWWPAVSVAISMTIFLCISFLRHHRKFQMKRRALIEYMEYELLRNASFSAGSLSSPSRRPPSNPHGDISPRGVPTHIPSHSNSSQANATHLPHFQHHHPTNHMSAAASSSTASASTLSNLATAAASATQADPATHHHHHHHHHHYQPHQQQHHQHQQHHQQQQAPDSVYNVSNSLTERRRYNNVRHNDPSQQVALNGYPSKFIQRFLQPNVNPCGLESSSNFTESACCEQSRDFCDHPLDKKESISTRKGSKKYKYTRSRNDDKSGVYRKYRILEEDFDLSVPSDYGSQTTSGIIELKPQGYGPAPQHPYHPQGGQQTYHQVHPHSKSHHANHLPPPAPTPAPQPLAPHQQQLHLEQQQKHKALHQQRDLQRGNRNYNTNIMQLLDVSELQNQSSRL